MSAPEYVTSDNYGHAGLYVQERPAPPNVQGRNLNVIGFAAQCVRGPVGQLIPISDTQRFVDVYGGRDYGNGGTLIGEGWKALLNKKFGKMYVVRAAAAAATIAEKDFVATATPIVNIAASSAGAWGADILVTIENATDGNANHCDVVATWNNRVERYKNLDVTTGIDNTASVMAATADEYARLITITKLADGRPDNVSGSSLTDTAGSDGTLADTDFTATGGPIELLGNSKDVDVAFVAGRSTTAVKAKINTVEAASSHQIWLICPDDDTVTDTAAETEATGLTLDDRLWYLFNHPYTLDPETALEIVTEPMAWMASILAQTDPDVHPGDPDNRQYLAGITKLTNTLSSTQFTTLKSSGICALEQDGGYLFVDVVATDGSSGAARRMKDFLLTELAARLLGSVKKPNTKSRRLENKGVVEGYLRFLWRQQRYVDYAEDGTSPGYQVDTESLNSSAGRAAGVEKLLVRVKLIGFMEELVLAVEIGTTVKITDVQAAA